MRRKLSSTHPRPKHSLKFAAHWRLTKLCSTILVSIVMCAPAEITLADEFPNVRFRNIKAIGDTQFGDANFILQDKQGYIWLDADTALCRFDGYKIKRFEHDTSNPKALSHVPIVSLNELSNYLWITTNLELNRYNPITESFDRYPIPKTLHKDGSSLHFRHSISLNENTLLLASFGGGALQFNTHTLTYSRFSYAVDKAKYPLAHNPRQNHLRILFRDSQNTIWVGSDGNGIYRVPLDGRANSWLSPHGDGKDVVRAIAEDEQQNIWVGTYRGVFKISANGTITPKFNTQNNRQHRLESDIISSLHFDRQGDLWIGTDGGGLNLYKADLDQLKTYRHDAHTPNSIQSDVIRTIYEDAIGDIWVGTYPSGYSVFHRANQNIKQYKPDANNNYSLNNASVLSLEQGEGKAVWVGTDGGGLNLYQPKSNQFTHFTQALPGLASNAILDLEKDHRGNLWVGTWGGTISKFNTATQKFTHYPSIENDPNTPSHKNIWTILHDTKGQIWIGTEGRGINRYDPQTDKFTRIPFGEKNEISLWGQLVWVLYEDAYGYIWVGAGGGMLSRLDPNTMKFKHFSYADGYFDSLASNNVHSIAEDKNGRLWLGTRDGLFHFDYTNEQFIKAPIGKNFDKGYIFGLTPDNNGDIWLGTTNGISRYTPETNTLKNFNRQYWGKGKINQGATLKLKNGEILFGSINGLTWLKTNAIRTNTTIPPIVFTDFQIFNKSVPIGGENSPLKSSLNFMPTISLNYKTSMISFEFSALNYYETENNQYKYKLKGFDRNWVDIKDERKAVYTNLDPGTYTLHAIGSNNDDIWNNIGAEIQIIQHPPPWRTWWAYTLYSLSFLCALSALIYSQYRKRRFAEQQNILLEEKVAKRTAELNEKNQDIQSMLNNMQQGLFTINAQGTIQAGYSRFLEEILDTNEIQGKSFFDIIDSHADITADKKNQLKNTVDLIIDQDIINYDFNRNVLLKEFHACFGPKNKTLTLDWNPIVQEYTTIKLMITVRDITQLKAMEAEATQQRRELSIISHLIKITPYKFTRFKESSTNELGLCQKQLNSQTSPTISDLDKIFRCLHTLKGNARTFGFSYIASEIHHTETALDNLRQHANKTTIAELQESLKTTTAVITEYAHIFHNVLRQPGTQCIESNKKAFVFEEASLDRIIKNLRAIETLHPNNPHTEDIESIILNQTSAELCDILDDVIIALPPIAETLGKPAPHIEIDGQYVRFKQSSHKLLQDMFTHLLNNSIDHGIESPQTRQEKGKDTRGKITIRIEKAKSTVEIRVSDDGRGVNINKLQKLGINKRLLHADNQPDPQAIANLIFEPALSTKQSVSDISGRGVGLDAVKQLLQENSGDIQLHLLAPFDSTADYRPFEFIITLSDKQCVTKPKF